MASYDRSDSFIRSGISAVWNSQKEIRRMSEIKAFFIRLVILLIFLWLLFGVFFGITPMRGNDMFPRISAGDLLLYYR